MLFLHDADEAVPVALAATLSQLRLAGVVPRGGPWGWLDRPCPNYEPSQTPFALLTECLPRVAELTGVPERGVAVVGIGMGGMTALRLALQWPTRFRTAVAFSPACDFHELVGHGTVLDEFFATAEQARQETPILHIVPAQPPANVWFGCPPTEPWWRLGCERLHSKLVAMGYPHTADLTTPGGAPVEYAAAQVLTGLQFAAEAVMREQRRLL
jgi:S-formylglutathione hydrolase